MGISNEIIYVKYLVVVLFNNVSNSWLLIYLYSFTNSVKNGYGKKYEGIISFFSSFQESALFSVLLPQLEQLLFSQHSLQLMNTGKEDIRPT